MVTEYCHKAGHSFVLSIGFSRCSAPPIIFIWTACSGRIYIVCCCCCCLPSETYGRNGMTPIFRSFHRTASSTTGGWSRWNIVMCFFLYIILSTTVSFLEDTILFYNVLFFHFVYISILFRKYTLRLCYVFNVI